MLPGSTRSVVLGARGGTMTVTDGTVSAAAFAAVDSACRCLMRGTMPIARSAARPITATVVIRLTREGATEPFSMAGDAAVSSVFISFPVVVKVRACDVRMRVRHQRRFPPELAVDNRYDEKRRNRGNGEPADPGA